MWAALTIVGVLIVAAAAVALGLYFVFLAQEFNGH